MRSSCVVPKNRLHSIFFLILVSVFIVGGFVVYGIFTALKAENTLHAYRLVLDVTSMYCERHGAWPQNWDDLLNSSPNPNLNRSFGDWEWPEDNDAIRSRIVFDFSLTLQEVGAMNKHDFSAIRQIPPCFEAGHPEIERLIFVASQQRD